SAPVSLKCRLVYIKFRYVEDHKMIDKAGRFLHQLAGSDLHAQSAVKFIQRPVPPEQRHQTLALLPVSLGADFQLTFHDAECIGCNEGAEGRVTLELGHGVITDELGHGVDQLDG